MIVWDDQASPDQESPYVLDETTGTSLKITVIPFNAIGEGAELDHYRNPET